MHSMPPPAGSTSLFWSRAGCTLNSLVSWIFLPGFDTMFNEDTRAWVVQYDGYIVRQNKFVSWTKFCYTVDICKYIRTDVSEQDYFRLFALEHCRKHGLMCECKVERMLFSSFDSHNEKLHSLWVNIEIN